VRLHVDVGDDDEFVVAIWRVWRGGALGEKIGTIFQQKIGYGVVANIADSHSAARGSIPRSRVTSLIFFRHFLLFVLSFRLKAAFCLNLTFASQQKPSPF
jgi:hypothetical protein